MNVLNTQMHVVTFIFTAFELAILFFAVIWYLSRPKDKARKRYVILLSLLIMYNVLSALFPDEGFTLPIKVQMIFAYLGGFSVSMYFVYYIYKTLELERLRTIAVYGSIWCLFLPFILLFVVPYTITGNFDLSRRLTVAIPIGFSFFYIYTLTKAIWPKLKGTRQKVEKEGIIGLYISVLLWAMLPFIVFFDIDELVEHCITNTGFMIMSVVYVRAAIFQSRKDHESLLESRESLKRANETLQQKVNERTKQLEKLSEQRTNVFINMVHETKTPLTLINNCLDEIVEKYGSSDEMDITKMNLAKLNRNMNNFFDVHKLERGLQIYDHSEVTNYSSILRNVVSVFSQWANQKSITIIKKIEDDIYIEADPEALDSIASNLIENAIKYIPEGSTITIELKMQDSKAQLAVADNGEGISESHQKKIFMPYYQVNHKKKNAQGIGMGLAIVKKTVESIGGQLELSSNPMEGTRFSIHFTSVNKNSKSVHTYLKKPTTLLQREVELQEMPKVQLKPNLLIIEDNKQLLSYIQRKLSASYNVYLATSGAGALERLKHESDLPDLILSDVMMNDMDGFAMVDALRKQRRFNHIPIIFLSAIADQGKRIKGLKLGAVDFISKPFKIGELKLKIASILSKIKLQRVEIPNTTFTMNGNYIPPVDMEVSFDDRCKEFELTPRQSQITELMIEGKKYNEISDQLHISEKTVSRHATDIFKKLEINSKYELMNLFDKARKLA